MLLEDISELLEHEGLGRANEPNRSIFKGQAPAPQTTPFVVPQEIIALYEYPGEPPEHVKDQKEAIQEFPRFQVLVRGAVWQYAAASALAHRVHRVLDGFSGVINGVAYASIRAMQPPFFLDYDDGNRPSFACNYRVVKEPSPLP